MSIPFIGIEYDEPDPATYAGVRLRMGPEVEPEVFFSGDPTTDYLTAGCVVHYRMGPDARIMGSSSVDHFVMDGGTLEDEDPPQEKIEAAIAAARAYLAGRNEA